MRQNAAIARCQIMQPYTKAVWAPVAPKRRCGDQLKHASACFGGLGAGCAKTPLWRSVKACERTQRWFGHRVRQNAAVAISQSRRAYISAVWAPGAPKCRHGEEPSHAIVHVGGLGAVPAKMSLLRDARLRNVHGGGLRAVSAKMSLWRGAKPRNRMRLWVRRCC